MFLHLVPIAAGSGITKGFGIAVGGGLGALMPANMWQREFQCQNLVLDRYERTSPVKRSPSDELRGVRHGQPARRGLTDQRQPGSRSELRRPTTSSTLGRQSSAGRPCAFGLRARRRTPRTASSTPPSPSASSHTKRDGDAPNRSRRTGCEASFAVDSAPALHLTARRPPVMTPGRSARKLSGCAQGCRRIADT
jgi:hypothetical protein